ncbi:hypothetical protein [Limoniibacter endophyticus]|uniref:Uncharacterized protein n=1 Tax=Limoniibacter endophyticus TaxID=1565040 RepID=A0A8J3DR64_9HYPH|nr:hypothetical protein [Limoniibacter endophyticus]GHC68743.1 hypothetical protein GCM10010136_13780 [Limoniibacter endophyticus]
MSVRKATFVKVAVVLLGMVPTISAANAQEWSFDGGWTSWVKESALLLNCTSDGANMVAVGREHYGDENKNSRILCGRPVFDDRVSYVAAGNWSSGYKKSDVSFTCPSNEALVGYEMRGDENGTIKFMCGSITWGGQPVQLGRTTAITQKESNSGIDCTSLNPQQVIVGFQHRGDENGDTTITCALLEKPSE